MTAFAVGQTIVTSSPLMSVDGMAAARYTFQLVVEDSSGNLSAPVTAIVEVFPPAPQTTTRFPNLGTITEAIKVATPIRSPLIKTPLIREP